ncbi:MAG: cupin domain-containing protein [Halocynthiibacter sp.]
MKLPERDLVLGIAEFSLGHCLKPHCHDPGEFHLGLEGSGVVPIDGVDLPITPGVAIYTPSNAEHDTVAGPDGLKFTYGFPNSRFEDIEYRFTPEA